MIMIEEEARKKWCPFARSNNSAGANRCWQDSNPDDGTMCIASECMAWRWSKLPGDAEYPDGSGKNPFRGRCGLAGKV